ncbi:hypothetical protein GCM10010339_44010 [Streptomyces alanosinicus]|uniref:Tetratricopeptide repeat protein n=1 Tax=Streptomyces alanosinicus TaxID=68171 RepID=A0A918YJ89_9ACTN|nr:hypothetical protein GCM10010339_44010 [Streptomyces alanosinicus]
MACRSPPRLRRQVLPTARRTLVRGPTNPFSLDCCGMLAVPYAKVGRLDEAIDLFQHLMDHRGQLGPSPIAANLPSTLSALRQLRGIR